MFIDRTYIKIFLVFWLVTILTLLGANLLAQLLGISPDQHIGHSQKSDLTGPGGRLLREIVSDSVNYDQESLRKNLQRVPGWAKRHLYMIDAQGNDLLDRSLPDKVSEFTGRISSAGPIQDQISQDTNLYGRKIMLSDGSLLRLVLISPNDPVLRWKLYLFNFWQILLLSLLFSGAACYYLARYMTRDIQRLTEATRQFASGKLGTRVSERLSRRRGEVAELGRAFDHMAIRLQRTIYEQRRLIKDVSHELRTPLARLQVALALAQKRANREITDELNRIKRCADYLNDVISNILNLPITDQDDWELDDVVEIGSLLSVLTEASRDDARQRYVILNLDTGSEESLIKTRGNTLAGVFDNVIRNAIRYTAPDTPVDISIKPAEKGFCRIVISDQGPGVNADKLDAIFEPFFRTDEARCRKHGGYGLGLAIAKRTVELHGGKIWAELNPHGGLSVNITLPREPLQEEDN